MSQIVTGRLTLDAHPVSLAPLVAASVDGVRPVAAAKQIRLESDLEAVPPIMGDPDRLQQILRNLLSNALKFTPSGGCIQVRLRQVGATAQIAVTDSGVGIAPEFLPHVFDRFRQENGSSGRSFGGLGLGLAIVRQLVHLHGGIVKAESGGKGRESTFTVELPIAGSIQRRSHR